MPEYQLREPYASVLPRLTTSYQVVALTHMSLEHERLGRPPTRKELSAAVGRATGKDPSQEHLSRIVEKINRQISNPEERIEITPHRPFFRFFREVRAVHQNFVDQHGEPPTLRELRELLAQKGIRVSKTVINNIRFNRNEATPAERREFALSRRKGDVTVAPVRKAYTQAREYLEKLGIARAPHTTLVATFLRREGISVRRESLEARMRTSPLFSDLPLDKYYDISLLALRGCYTKLEATLGRPPASKELLKAYHGLGFRRVAYEDLVERIRRYNLRVPRAERMPLSRARGSGVYERDIRRVYKRESVRLKRKPTLEEMKGALESGIAGSRISVDRLRRVMRALKLAITPEGGFWKRTKGVIRDALHSLKERFGRRPLSVEVIREVKEKGTTVGKKELERAIASISRHDTPPESERQGVLRPAQVLGTINARYEEIVRSQRRQPTKGEIRAQLGWTEAGFEEALQPLYALAASRKRPPVVFADSLLGETLRVILESESLLEKRIRVGTITPFDLEEKLGKFVNGWELPVQAQEQDGVRLTFDEALARLQVWWIVVVCMNAPTRGVHEDLEVEAILNERKWRRGLGISDQELNPFEGFSQALHVAREAGRLSQSEFESTNNSVLQAPDRASAYASLRAEIARLAEQCGFPRRGVSLYIAPKN